MKVSRNALERYIDLRNISDEEIAKRLTFAGIETEDYYKLASGTNLVIGHVIKSTKVEGSDHLSFCQVDVGKLGKRNIICGAPNVASGQKVIVALDGAKLPAGDIKSVTIKGYQSEGMICSLSELGVPHELQSQADIEGIHVLNNDAPVGNTDVLNYLGLDDTIFDIRPLANRSDMLALYNIVRELGAIFDLHYNIPEIEVKPSFTTKLKLEVKTPLVPIFALTEVRNITIAPSPDWLATFLRKHGHRPVNNIVDIGNYVMLVTGRPLHMYDLDKVKDEHFVVSSDVTTTFIALDDKEYHIVPGDQIIHDADKVLCLGGINGARSSAVSEKTKRIAIEVAAFDTAHIRMSVVRHNLPSEASGRFGKGVNLYNTEEAMNLALSLIFDLVPNAKFSNTVTVEKNIPAQPRIYFAADKINKLLGTTFSEEVMLSTLNRLNITVNADKSVNLPLYRQDFFSLADLAEEIIRLQGFDHVGNEIPGLFTCVGSYDDIQAKRYDIRKLLRENGLYEVLTYTLTDADKNQTFTYLNNDEPLKLQHPMTPVRAELRLNLLPSVIETLTYNASRQQTDFAIFEISNITSTNYKGEHLAFAFYGNKLSQGELGKRTYDFYDAKGVVVSILDYLGINESRYEFVINPHQNDEFHPAQSALLKVQGKVVGIFGKLHPLAKEKALLGSEAVVGEINLSALLNLKTSLTKVNAPARFPFVKRDLALIIDEDVPVKDIINVIRKAGGKLVSDVSVFDVYTKLKDEPGKKSVALSLTLSDTNKTLVEEEIKDVMNKVVDELMKKLQVVVRGI
ncbi:MAG: Phenylalanine--tRNA ligase beta subunit [Tenericutes bacterium ADurb.Bin087]|nr:MAG: Phenylalanine--tRNA ligase beta subunit [Tenericutes bacterium ADurb.Bin087]